MDAGRKEDATQISNATLAFTKSNVPTLYTSVLGLQVRTGMHYGSATGNNTSKSQWINQDSNLKSMQLLNLIDKQFTLICGQYNSFWEFMCVCVCVCVCMCVCVCVFCCCCCCCLFERFVRGFSETNLTTISFRLNVVSVDALV